MPVAELAEQLPDVQPSEKELAMAKLLIESQLTEFEPEKYKNEYLAAVMSLIDRKAEQEAVISKAAPEGGPQVVDIMAAIEASLAALKENLKQRPKRRNRPNRITMPANCGRLFCILLSLYITESLAKPIFCFKGGIFYHALFSMSI